MTYLIMTSRIYKSTEQMKQTRDKEIGESIEDYKNGRYKQGTIEDLLADLNKDEKKLRVHAQKSQSKKEHQEGQLLSPCVQACFCFLLQRTRLTHLLVDF